MIESGVEIVIVEDNPSDAELLLRVFKKHNVANQIVLLKDGAEALEFLLPKGPGEANRSDRPRVIILDLKLPKINGIEVLRHLKADARTKETPIVVLTSSREERDLHDAYQAGVNSYVTKPIHFGEFAKVVSDLSMYWILTNRMPNR